MFWRSYGSRIASYILPSHVLLAYSVPMLILYPFVQKYFVKDVMLGSLKGQDIGKAFLIAAILFGSRLAAAGWPFITHALAAH